MNCVHSGLFTLHKLADKVGKDVDPHGRLRSVQGRMGYR